MTPIGGFALMGGGAKLAQAFKFLCDRANGGDFLVLSANDQDSYLEKENEQISALCFGSSESSRLEKQSVAAELSGRLLPAGHSSADRSESSHRRQGQAIAVEENTAVLVELEGTASVVGRGPVYFLEAGALPTNCAHKQPLSFSDISVQRVAPNHTSKLKTWKGVSDSYSLSVVDSAVKSSSPTRRPY